VSDRRPLGIFDSGVGGLTVLSAVRRRLPSEAILYLGDTARLPYGNKSAETVTRYTARNIAFLAAQGVKGVVVACNTASALGLSPALSQRFPFPIWGVVEAGARAAAQQARNHLGVLGTAATIGSGAYERWLSALRPNLRVEGVACPLFVPLVEEGWLEDPVTELVGRRYLEPLLESGVDTLLLGCTHYPLLLPTLCRIAGPSVAWVDSADAVAQKVAEDLYRHGLETPERGEGSLTVWLTDTAPGFLRLARKILSPQVSVERVDLPSSFERRDWDGTLCSCAPT
jgi:glutamate racemase